MSHIHLGKRQFAIKEIQQSLVLSDDNPAVLYNAGYIFMTIDSLDLAKEYLLKSVKAHGNSDGYYLLGLCAEQQGDTTDALHYYQLSSAASTGENDKSAREAAKKVTILIQE
jgi:tetratricopeptide (TPR) repeat protein